MMKKINLPANYYNMKLTPAQQKAAKILDKAGSDAIDMQAMAAMFDNKDGVDLNPAPGKVDINTNMYGGHMKMKAEFEFDGEPYVTKMDVDAVSMDNERTKIKYEDNADIDTDGDGKADAKGLFMEYESNGDKIKAYVNPNGSTTIFMEE